MTPRIFERRDPSRVRYVELRYDDGWLIVVEGDRGGTDRTSKKYASASAVTGMIADRVRDLERDGYTEVVTASGAHDPLEVAIAALPAAHLRELPALVATLRDGGAIDNVFALLDDASADLRIHGIAAIMALDGAAHGDRLRIAANDIDPAVRKAARQALKDLGTPVQLLRDRDDLHAVGWNGDTLLHEACEAGDVQAVQTLVASGAKLKALNDKRESVLHSATGYLGPREDVAAELLPKRRAVIASLLAHGAEVNARDEQDRTPLRAAARYLDRDACKLLIDAGAQDDKALTAAVDDGNAETALYLVDRGAIVTRQVIELAVENHHAKLAAELRRSAGVTDPARDDPRASLRALADTLGRESARSALNSGDLGYYRDQEDLDPDDLRSEYWDARYKALVAEAIAALAGDVRSMLAPDDEVLLDELYEVYGAGYDAES